MQATKDKHIRFRVTAQERALLEQAASKDERTLSGFCRLAALARARALAGKPTLPRAEEGTSCAA